MTLRFAQSCPTCGRRINIRLELLGRTIACPHCHAEFLASDRSQDGPPSQPDLMCRVDAVLRQAETLGVDVVGPTESFR